MERLTQSVLRSADPKDPRFRASIQPRIEEQEPGYYVALDLGQAQDYSALVVIALTHRFFDERLEPVCAAPQMKRWPLGTSYPALVTEVAGQMSKAPDDARLILDGTGVGRAVVDLFLEHPLLKSRGSRIVPVTITAGETESYADGYRRVPKRNLVGAVQALLQSQRLKLAASLPDTPTLVAELQNFRVKITAAANDTYGEWRAGQHDDLVLACALGCWAATSPSVNAVFTQGKMLR